MLDFSFLKFLAVLDPHSIIQYRENTASLHCNVCAESISLKRRTLGNAQLFLEVKESFENVHTACKMLMYQQSKTIERLRASDSTVAQ